MAFGLTIGTDRAAALQNAIQDELTKRGYSAEADPVMAEYITIMVINNKTADQINSELEDLIGGDFDRSFTDWLFAEAAKGAPDSESDAPPSTIPDQSQPPSQPESTDPSRRSRSGAPLYQQALHQISTTSPSSQKRTASARSPSPAGHTPNKSRRTDLPTGPRAMANGHPHGGGSRSLLERVGGRAANNHRGRMNDEIQARIDNITANSPDPAAMMGSAGFPGPGPAGMPVGMDMSMMNNPMVLQEMMVNQMALMAQMAGAMGIINPPGGGFMNGPGFPMGGGDMYAAMNAMQQQQQQQQMGMGGGGGGGHRGRQAGRGTGTGRGRGGGRGGGASSAGAPVPHPPASTPTPAPAPVAAAQPAMTTHVLAPTPQVAAPSIAGPTPVLGSRPGFVPPERPQSPTLCKYALRCTNPLCRYSHPSPVATPESGVVLSNDACEAGKNCKDKDCIKSHISPAVLTAPENIKPTYPTSHTPQSQITCRFGVKCARISSGCPYIHPARSTPADVSKNPHFAQACRFGAGCTKASCPFQHPEGRVLPTMFHKGLSTSGPLETVNVPATGTMGAGPSPHRSVTFNAANKKGELEKRMKELEERKSAAEAKVKEAEAGAGAKKNENSKGESASATPDASPLKEEKNSVPISAS